MRLLLLVLLALIAAFPATAQNASASWQVHWTGRLAAIEAQAAVAGQGNFIPYGDSNYEGLWWAQYGTCRAINGGFGGADINDLANMAPAVANATRPRYVIYGGGTNNLGMSHSDPEWASMQADLQRGVDAFEAVGAKVILMHVPPFAASLSGAIPLADRAHINSIITAVGAANNISVNWWWAGAAPGGSGQITGSSGYALSGAMNGDGIHYSANTAVLQHNEFVRLLTWATGYYGVPCQ